ncbi:hypothetical protein GA0061098_1002278 [Bradyrhizobium shewense]|uniref:Uncharacterized protein n=1 Tax=Bradyrhizobium shewense TaxID=1761772 RepID=A0A1C3UQ16_9BRAD|nr:hypothetical protein GA0061098_1002278 [Bradyrhizobium shewense]
MIRRSVAELPKKQELCAGSDLPARVLLKAFAQKLFPIEVAVA